MAQRRPRDRRGGSLRYSLFQGIQGIKTPRAGGLTLRPSASFGAGAVSSPQSGAHGAGAIEAVLEEVCVYITMVTQGLPHRVVCSVVRPVGGMVT